MSKSVRQLFFRLVVSVLGCSVAALFFQPAVVWVLLCGILCCGWTAHYCHLQRKDINALSEYLASVYTGGKILDIRTQQEGELNALKEDIYKITVILSEQKEYLQHEKKLLADFLGNVAHQLKTPLSAILLQTEVWNTPDISIEQKQFCANSVEQSAQKMQWLTEQLLKLCRLDAAVVTFQPEHCTAQQIVETACHSFRELSKTCNIRLECNINKNFCVFCDRAWTAEALSNIIKNGFEHTPTGGTVWIWCEQTALYTDFCIKNSGNPLSDHEKSHLFERFWKGNHSKNGSIGIGLSLAKAIAQGQNARIWAENHQDGVCFVLRFPNK